MKILHIPTYWTADQAETIHNFLGQVQAAVWQEYHEAIQGEYKEIKECQMQLFEDFKGDDIEF